RAIVREPRQTRTLNSHQPSHSGARNLMSFSPFRHAGVPSLIAAALALSLTGPLHAQTSGVATISGTIYDASGAAVPKATVEVRDTDTGVSRSLTSNDQGEYAAPFLQPGHYEVIVSAPGFSQNDRNNLVLTVGQVLTVDANLTAAGA